MHPPLFLVASALLVLTSLGIAAGADLFSLTKPWLDPRPSERAVPKVEESIRLKMIAELTEAKRLPGVVLPYGAPKIDILLIDLGDEVTINQYIEDYFGPTQRRSAIDVLYAARQPSLIAHLVPFLFKAESAETKRDGEESMMPRSLAASQICLTLIQKCSEFDGSVQKWAFQLQKKSRSRAALRDEVRAFWQENEAHLKAKNYQTVRPPSNAAANPPGAQPGISRTNSSPAVPVPTPGSTSSPSAVIASNSPQIAAPAVAAITKPAPIPSSSPTNATSSDASPPPPVWPWLLVVGIALATVLWRRSH